MGENSIYGKDLRKAFRLALTLDKPGKIMHIISVLVKQESYHALAPIIKDLSDNHLERLLKYTTSWNTHSKNCAIAQRVLNSILSEHNPNRLATLVEFRQLLPSMLSYTERHVRRVDKLNAQATFIDFITGTAGYGAGLPVTDNFQADSENGMSTDGSAESSDEAEHLLSIKNIIRRGPQHTTELRRKAPRDIFAQWAEQEEPKDTLPPLPPAQPSKTPRRRQRSADSVGSDSSRTTRRSSRRIAAPSPTPERRSARTKK